jgi:hypothetical protein
VAMTTTVVALAAHDEIEEEVCLFSGIKYYNALHGGLFLGCYLGRLSCYSDGRYGRSL